MNNVKTITIANRDGTTYSVNSRRAKLITGEVDQRQQVALNNRQLNDGYVVLCVARPVTDCTIEIGVESHDNLYRNPFLDPLEPHELKADIATPKES